MSSNVFRPLTDFVAMPVSGVVYVLVASREKFDAIPRPVTDHRPAQDVLVKVVEQDGVIVTFQYWTPVRHRDPCAYCGSDDHVTESPAGDLCRERQRHFPHSIPVEVRV